MGSDRDLSVVICGAAGLGVQTVEDILAKVMKRSGYHVFACREYMSRVRGGNNSTEIRIGSSPVDGLVDRIDLLVALSPGIRENIRRRIGENTVIAADGSVLGDELAASGGKFRNVPLQTIAKEEGSLLYSSVVAAGIILGITEASEDEASAFFFERFGKKGDETMRQNLSACRRGIALGKTIRGEFPMMPVPHKGDTSERRILGGSEAVAMGAVAGGCDFVTAYPMAPATGVLGFAAKNASRLGLVVEQAEDEPAAINMAVGASYAGASPMVTTSGGGFSLMYEGFSLAGIAETPLVVHLGQRPGPATGMATRTEQGDLMLAIHAGHGEFPRLVLAPGTLEEAFQLTAEAFRMVQAYQVQAVVLTDQYILNTLRDIPAKALTFPESDKGLTKSGEGYRRYEDTPDGVSPRSVPGYGTGLVGCDSHEHDEEGHVFEDFDLRVRMSDKRFRKENLLMKNGVPGRLSGPENWTRLVLCWGSTGPIVEEALSELSPKDVALLRIRQMWPMMEEDLSLVRSAKEFFVIEGNHDGQLEAMIRRCSRKEANGHLRNYCGLQFSVEQVREGLSRILL